MIVEIKLKNSKYCTGCPCIAYTEIGTEMWCSVDGGMNIENGYIGEIVRPQQCIDKYGA